ncbi:MAG TPA: SDR family oxidoreductase [Myxococcaceae bacterium]|nr:SDR family oxidoreductase [Myxococcaceae bacterium]
MRPIPSDLGGKTFVITGASSGIGKATALALARAGANLLLICRDSARGEAAAEEIREQSDNPLVNVLLAELASLDSIREVSRAIHARCSRLDVLINNAGIHCAQRRLSPDGLELTFATNHLAYFLLTQLLLDLLKASPSARIVNVSSEAHRRGTIDFDNLQGEKQYRAFRAYSNSKLANVLFTYELAGRLKGTRVTANCLHPGTVRTNFGRGEPGFFRAVVKLAAPFMLSPEKGAETSIYLASSPEVEDVSGKYFIKCAQARSSSESYDQAKARRLWDISAQLTRSGELAA